MTTHMCGKKKDWGTSNAEAGGKVIEDKALRTVEKNVITA